MRNNKKHKRHAFVLLLAAAGMIICTNSLSASLGLASAQTVAPSWTSTGSLNVPRSGHIATLLPNGKVLVAGGYSSNPLDSAELYDPATGTWSVTGSLNVPRVGLSATLLPNGKVLVVGGSNRVGLLSASGTAELYDPTTGRWSLTSSPHFTHWGSGLTTLLADGRVLIAGGFYSVNTVMGQQFGGSDKAEIYDPATDTWIITGSLRTARFAHTATLLQSGQVLVAGGDDTSDYFSDGIEGTVATYELYDPNTGTWSDAHNVNQGRGGHTATLLQDGFVLTAGGRFYEELSGGAELTNPLIGLWNYTGSLNTPRANHTATLLPNGQVLIAGGYTFNGNSNSAEIYVPTTGSWSATASLNTARAGHTATLLPNGKVLVVGGSDGGYPQTTYFRSAELYDSGTGLIPNQIDDPQFFVRQHYRDFLNREADPEGLGFWMNEITSCRGDQACLEVKRINDSGSFFLSIEFQETGYLAYRTYLAAFGNLPNAPVPITFGEFIPDTQAIGRDVVVRQSGWENILENNKRAFLSAFVQRSRFTSAFPPAMSAREFVDKLNANADNLMSEPERNQLISDLSGGRRSRAEVLRAVAENPKLAQAEFKRAFVLMQYFGYLRRNPNDAPDGNFVGYNFWLDKLNSFNGDFIQAEMVKAFISSTEYRRRFGP